MNGRFTDFNATAHSADPSDVLSLNDVWKNKELTYTPPCSFQRRGGSSEATMIFAAVAAVSCMRVCNVNSVLMALLACSASCSSVGGSVASGDKRGNEPTPVVCNSSFSV